MLKYDGLFALLNAHGYNAARIRKENVLGQATYYGLKNGTKGIDAKSIDKLCSLLHCQPGDIMEWVPDDEAAVKDKEKDSI